ncbi:MAG: type II toxin-antitoxin system VapC family toxin [Thermomicrobiales bacterium]
MIVVDTSVAVKWLFREEEHTVESFALLAHELAGGSILAPPLLRSEVTNAIRQRLRRDHVTRDEALVSLDRFLSLPITITEPDDLYRQALFIAADYNLPAAYDAHFVALAQTHACDMWTADQRLLSQLDGRLSFVRWIVDYRE